MAIMLDEQVNPDFTEEALTVILSPVNHPFTVRDHHVKSFSVPAKPGICVIEGNFEF